LKWEYGIGGMASLVKAGVTPHKGRRVTYFRDLSGSFIYTLPAYPKGGFRVSGR